MSFIDKLKTLWLGNKQERKLQQGLDIVQTAYDESETKQEATKNAINAVVDAIKANPQMPAYEFLKLVDQSTSLTDPDFAIIIKKLFDVIPDQKAINVFEKSKLPQDLKALIVEEANTSLDTTQQMIETMPDGPLKEEQQAKLEKQIEEEQRILEKEQEKKVLAKLTYLYNNCDNIADVSLAGELKALNIPIKTNNINNLLKNIVAKKIALGCMKYGGPRIPTMLSVMPATEMLENDLPNLVNKEYQKQKNIYESHNLTYPTFTSQMRLDIKKQILENIAKKVASDYLEVGTINVPQMEELKNLNSSEVEIFVNAVRIACTSEQFGKIVERIDESDLNKVKKQLKGEVTSDIQDLVRILEKMSPKDRESSIENFINSLKSDINKDSEQRKLDESFYEIKHRIMILPKNLQLPTAKAINQALEQKEFIDHKPSSEEVQSPKTDTGR